MKRFVVDTNVPTVANGRAPPEANGRRPSIECQIASIEFHNWLRDAGKVLLDIGGDIQKEYHEHLFPKGEPGNRRSILLRSAPKRRLAV